MQNIFASFTDEIARAWRFRWFGLWVACALAVIGTAVTILLPNYYTSHAKIYLNTRSLLQPLLEGIAVESNLSGQLALVRKTLLSDPNLEKIVRTVDTGINVDTGAGLEKAKNALRKRIAVDFEDEEEYIFSVTYDDTEPVRAHDVVDALLKIFIQANLRESFTETQGAREFIDEQIAEYERQLRKIELELAKFRVDYPEVVGTEGVSTRLDAARAAMAAAQLDYRQAVAWRDQLRAELKAMERGEAADASRTLDDQLITATIDRINTLRTELETLRLSYTESHPDVVARRRELETLASQFGRNGAVAEALGAPEAAGAPEAGAGAVALVPSAEAAPAPASGRSALDTMRIRLIQAEAQVLKAELALERARTDLRSVEGISAASNKSDQLAALTRDYQVMRDSYSELLRRREAARISQAVDTSPGVVPYRVVVPPSVPTAPSKPNRVLWLALWSMGAILGGGAAAYLRAMNAGIFVRAEEIETAFGLPVVGAVSRIDGALTKLGRTAETTSFLLSFGGLIVALALLVFVAAQFEVWREQAHRAFDSIMESIGPAL